MPRHRSDRPFVVTDYFEHDNRGEEVRRTVSFKQTRGHSSGGGVASHSRNRNAPSKWNRQIQNQLNADFMKYDADVDMGGSGRRNIHPSNRGSRFAPRIPRRNGRQNSPAPMRKFRRLPTSNTFWYKVVVLHGARYERKWIVDNLNAGIAPDTFTAISFQTQGKDAVFYLDDHKIGEKLLNLDRRLSTHDGYKLGVFVKPMKPSTCLDDSLKELLKVVMSKRYTQETSALDLSRFHLDPDLIDKFVALNQTSMLCGILSLVADNCPSLHALDLSCNHIYSLEGVKASFSKMPNLRILLLANNQMTQITSLDPLKGLGIEELLMHPNPLCGKYADQGTYVTDIRKRLPKLLKLDTIALPPPILFDVDTAQLPPSRGSYLCDQAGKEIAERFLAQYYAIYDSASREPLRDAYHEKAMFSMSCGHHQTGQAQGHGNRDKPLLSVYYPNSRNLKRISDLDRRMRLLMHGHDEIMKLLCNLPSTQHDPRSLAVDLLLFTPQLIQLCVCGVFRETGTSSNTPMRAFSRSLIIVPQGQGFCIVNETLTITNATSSQANAAFKTSLVPVAPAPAVAPAVVPLVPVPVSPSVGISTHDVETKRHMVEHVASVSGMNLSWSEKCLVESEWNLEQALYVFSELHKQGTIPPEAFVR